jgi:hypothetical protein
MANCWRENKRNCGVQTDSFDTESKLINYIIYQVSFCFITATTAELRTVYILQPD